MDELIINSLKENIPIKKISELHNKTILEINDILIKLEEKGLVKIKYITIFECTVNKLFSDYEVLELLLTPEKSKFILPLNKYGLTLKILESNNFLAIKETKTELEICLLKHFIYFKNDFKNLKILKILEINNMICRIEKKIIVNYKYRDSKNLLNSIDAYGLSKPLKYVQFLKNIRIFLLLNGFKEIKSEYITSNFWNFEFLRMDKLHPARRNSDTFYLEDFENIPELLAHNIPLNIDKTDLKKDGEFYKSPLSLKTHNTGSIFKHIIKNKITKGNFFMIDRVFRNEREDMTHTISFRQLEITMIKNSKFEELIGFIKDFCSFLGFEDVLIKPTYYPYTEPSCEIQVKIDEKYVEIGGGGLFRSSVLKPVNKNLKTSIGFGFGIERLYMVKEQITTINSINNIY